MDGVAIANKAMEGRGFYNRNADLQAAGIELILPLLEEAALAVPIDGDGPLVIADYGSSQGRNSMRPMRVAIETLMARVGRDRPIEVVHTDLPENDFAALFTALAHEPDSYLSGLPNVFPSAIGRSYFQPILPAGRVHLGWNTWTLHWMSQNPVECAEHVMAILGGSADEHRAVEEQLARDWIAFLRARSVEMSKGARLVLLCQGRGEAAHGWEWVVGALWTAAKSLAEEGLVSVAEITRFTSPCAGRRVKDLEAPFAEGAFHGLVLDRAEVIEAPDPFWNEYLECRDAEQLGRRWEGMLRAVSGPIAAEAFADHADADALVDELFSRTGHLIAAAPEQHEHYVAIAVLRRL